MYQTLIQKNTMFRKLLFLLAIPVYFTVTGCGQSAANNKNIPGMSVYDLSSYNAPITIYVPDTTKTKLEPSLQSSGSINIKSGKDFQISITSGEGDMALTKGDIKDADVKKFKRYLMDEPDAIIWESQVSGMESEYHFYTIVKAGKDSYVIEDMKDGDAFSEAAIRKMMDAAKSVKVKEAKKV